MELCLSFADVVVLLLHPCAGLTPHAVLSYKTRCVWYLNYVSCNLMNLSRFCVPCNKELFRCFLSKLIQALRSGTFNSNSPYCIWILCSLTLNSLTGASVHMPSTSFSHVWVALYAGSVVFQFWVIRPLQYGCVRACCYEYIWVHIAGLSGRYSWVNNETF